MKYKKCCRNCEHAYLESCKNCSTFGDNAYENFELRKELAKIESGKLVAMPVGWLDALKLLTCAAMCYADIDNMIASGMQNSKELADLFMNIPRVQGSTLQWSLQDLANSKLDCNKIAGFEEVLNAMPKFKARVQEAAETLVNAGYGDTKQAVREFAEKVKELLLANTAPCFNMGAEPIIEFDPFFYDKLDQLVKETCGE